MTRFRCSIIDESGSPATRIIDAYDRNQTILLLLLEGAQPVTIERDAPSLMDRVRVLSPYHALDHLLSPIARLVDTGLSVPGAAALIENEAANRIAAGEAVGQALTGIPGTPRWIGEALLLAAARGDERGAIVRIVADAAAIARRRRAARSSQVETAAVLLVALMLVASLSFAGPLMAVGLAIVTALVMRSSRGPVSGVFERLRVAMFLQILARLSSEGAATPNAVRLAASDTLTGEMRARIAALPDGMGMLASVAGAVHLSPVDTAMLLHGEPATQARGIAGHLAASATEQLARLAQVVRVIALMLAALSLIPAVAW